MEEGILLEADIDEGRLQSVFQIADLALENAADQPLLGRALDGELLELALLQHSHAGFEGLGVDDDFLVHLLHRLDQPLHLLDHFGGGRLDGVDEALRGVSAIVTG